MELIEESEFSKITKNKQEEIYNLMNKYTMIKTYYQGIQINTCWAERYPILGYMIHNHRICNYMWENGIDNLFESYEECKKWLDNYFRYFEFSLF